MASIDVVNVELKGNVTSGVAYLFHSLISGSIESKIIELACQELDKAGLNLMAGTLGNLSSAVSNYTQPLSAN